MSLTEKVEDAYVALIGNRINALGEIKHYGFLGEAREKDVILYADSQRKYARCGFYNNDLATRLLVQVIKMRIGS